MQNFPWDNKIPVIKNKKMIGGRQCKVIIPTIEQTVEFLNDYHYQKSCNGQIIRYGLDFQGILVAVMTFGYARYRRNCQYELLRLCFHPEYSIMGGSEKMFNRFLEDYTPHSVISYCDKSKFSGGVYLRLGMEKITNGRPGEHYWRQSDSKHVTAVELVKHGADALISTNLGKGANNKQIMLDNGFEIIKDAGQDAYLYLDDSQFFGYIYCTTDMTNGKKYVGMHISNKFDPNYYGSGTIIKQILKNRPETLKVEVLEWCKQDIGEREIYYIEKFDTMTPNGYNLTKRRQWFDYHDGAGVSASLKAFYQTEEGKISRKRQIEKRNEFYQTEEGKESRKKQSEKRKKWLQTPEGQEFQAQRVINYKNWCQTEEGKEKLKQMGDNYKTWAKTEEGKEIIDSAVKKRKEFYDTSEGKDVLKKQKESRKAWLQSEDGQQTMKQVGANRKAWFQTEEGKNVIKEQKEKLINLYQTEEGKMIAKARGKKYQTWANTEEGKEKLKQMADNYKAWTKTEEGKEAIKKRNEKVSKIKVKKIIEKVNAMSDDEWEEFIKKHPKTKLVKYRGGASVDQL